MFAFFGFSVFFLFFGPASATDLAEKCAPESLLDGPNRDDEKPTFPLKEDLRLKTSNIFKAHKILRNGLQQFLEFREEDLGFYLNYIVINKPPLKDEHGQEIRSYYKVFKFIWVQFNETLCQNYAINQYDKDKLDLCSVARFLSHKSAVDDRETIMKRMGDALGYKCHPCTPYKRKEHGGTLVPNTDDISPVESLSLEQILLLCKHYDHNGQPLIALSSTAPPSTTSATTTTITTATNTQLEINETVKPTDSSLFDYTPCSYSNGELICDQVSIEEIQKVFKRTALPRLVSVKLTLRPFIFSETFIPKDVFGTKKTFSIWIQYPIVANRSLSLQVDEDAFRSTKSYTNQFIINNIDCTLLDLGFLSGFDQLTELTFGTFNIQHCLPSLPPLPRLTTLIFQLCTGMYHLNIFPTLTNGLKQCVFSDDVNISDNPYNDETINRILDWLLLSSANTLEELAIIGMKKVTRVPHKIASFQFLSKVWLYDNNITTLKSGAFSFSAPVSFLRVTDNGIKEIEPDAFQGDFTDAEVYVYNNNLTRFEESVFGPMLRQMASGKGFISASDDNGNPIDCSEESICHLAWLRRYQVNVKCWLKCSNGTSFEDLQPAGFNHCPL